MILYVYYCHIVYALCGLYVLLYICVFLHSVEVEQSKYIILLFDRRFFSPGFEENTRSDVTTAGRIR